MYLRVAMCLVQVWAAVLKSYQFQRLKVVVRKRPFVNGTSFKCRKCKMCQVESISCYCVIVDTIESISCYCVIVDTIESISC